MSILWKFVQFMDFAPILWTISVSEQDRTGIAPAYLCALKMYQSSGQEG